MVDAYNISTWEVEVGESQVWSQPGLHSKTLTLKKKTKNKKPAQLNENSNKLKLSSLLKSCAMSLLPSSLHSQRQFKDRSKWHWCKDIQNGLEKSSKFSPLLVAFYFCVQYWGLNGLHPEPLYQPFFMMGFLEIGSQKLLCPGWLRILILLISASWVARIIDMHHQCLAFFWVETGFYYVPQGNLKLVILLSKALKYFSSMEVISLVRICMSMSSYHVVPGTSLSIQVILGYYWTRWLISEMTRCSKSNGGQLPRTQDGPLVSMHTLFC
jgi:hypothetical protein